MKVQTTAIVLHGPTSSGKSSLAKALQASATAPAFHISLDAFVSNLTAATHEAIGKSSTNPFGRIF